MANDKLFTLPITAGQTYAISTDSSACSIAVSNDSTSVGNITIDGTAQMQVNSVLTNSTPISITPNESVTISATTPIVLTIVSAAATTGKLIAII